MTIRLLELREGEPPRAVELDDGEARALDASDLAVVRRAPSAAGWEVSAGRKVGVVRIGDDLQVVVRPKIHIARLLFMMGYARDPSFWRDQKIEMDRERDLASALADTFRRLASAATERGLLQGYRTTEESIPVMRGKLRVADQIRRRSGGPLPLEVTYDDFTIDIPENRLLLAAVVRLLLFPGLTAEVRSSLHRFRLAFADVELVSDAPLWVPTRLNSHYLPALRLAEIILDGDSIEEVRRVHPVEVGGFVLDMWKIYEDFVCMALKAELEGRGGRGELQYTAHFDEGGRVSMSPDFVWTTSGRPQVIVDAKYKEERSSSFPNADLYQMLAYCTTLRRRHGHLIYAKGSGSEREVRVAGSDVVVHCHTLDLAAPPDELLAQVASLAEKLMRPRSLRMKNQVITPA